MPTSSDYVSYRDYYRRFSKELIRDLLRLGKGQMVGAILAVAILFLQVHFGLIPHRLAPLSLLAVLSPYAIVILILCAISAVRAPVLIDRGRAAKIGELERHRLALEESKNHPEPSEKAIHVLLALAEGMSTNTAAIDLFSAERFLRVGNMQFCPSDPIEWAEYQETVESELPHGGWIKRISYGNLSHYEPTGSGLRKAQELFNSPSGKETLNALRKRFVGR